MYYNREGDRFLHNSPNILFFLKCSQGFLLEFHLIQGTAEEWDHIYLLFGCLLSMSCLIFTFTGSAKRQKWADTQQPTAF